MNFTGVPQNIYGEFLSKDMVNFSKNVMKKREECFAEMEKSENVVFPQLKHLTVMRDKELDDLLYEAQCENVDS